MTLHQLLAWLDHLTYAQTRDRLSQRPPEGFSMVVSIPTLHQSHLTGRSGRRRYGRGGFSGISRNQTAIAAAR